MTIDATFWVGVSFLLFFGVLIYLKVPQKINEILSKLINDIKNEATITPQVIDDVGYPILLDVCSNMGFSALIFSSLIPLVHMGGLMVFAMLSTSFGTLTILAAIMEITKHKLKV